MSVDLQRHAAHFCRVQHRIHIKVCPFTIRNESSGGMTDDVHVRILYRVDRPLRHLLARLAQTAVHGCDDNIERL